MSQFSELVFLGCAMISMFSLISIAMDIDDIRKKMK